MVNHCSCLAGYHLILSYMMNNIIEIVLLQESGRSNSVSNLWPVQEVLLLLLLSSGWLGAQ